MVDLDRREFLKVVGITGAAAAAGGCSDSSRHLIPYLIPSRDVLPGIPTWYATTCRECPAGCGLLAKNRDGHVIKAEGNPIHPVSGGGLCPRGQASLQRLYNPDRFTGPMQRNREGKLSPVTWDQGEDILVRYLADMKAKGRGERIVLITELTTGSMYDLMSLWLAELGSKSQPVLYEPFAYEPLRTANKLVFGYEGIPHYHIDQADYLISFGAGFLETWLSNVEYARQFGEFHPVGESGRHPFVFVGPRLSVTANNADLWLSVNPGDEYLVALGMLRTILDENLIPGTPASQQSFIASMIAQWPMEAISQKTGIEADAIRRLARQFAQAKAPLALAEGLSLSKPNATETAVAVNLLSSIHPGALKAVDFSSQSAYSSAARASELKELCDRLKHKEVDLLLIHNANPVHSLPLSWDVRKAIETVPMVVTFSSIPDETSSLAHLVVPANTPLESWGDYSPRQGVTGLMQPTMGCVFDTKHPGDVLLSTGKKLSGNERFPWNSYYDVLRHSWGRQWEQSGKSMQFEDFWQHALMHGGVWPKQTGGKASQSAMQAFEFEFPQPGGGAGKSETAFSFTAYPTVQFYDGRTACSPWIQEFPDPITQTTWGGWVEIHPHTAGRLSISKGDVLRLSTPHGAIEAPALPLSSVPPDTLAMPIGQGHTDYGRYATGLPANPMHLLPAELDAVSGAILRPAFDVRIEKTGKVFAIANTDGSHTIRGRHDILQTTNMHDYIHAVSTGEEPEITLPLPEAYKKEDDIYPAHEHKDYRWAMVIDLDRCIGCGACVVACYAENNVAFVGREQMLKGREMSWIRVQRYFSDDNPYQANWLVMMCQHCDNAPCESVCPVFAPQHNVEGLNNQIYNRCFGTRFCSQNDPYKVRRFNWYWWTRPDPLNLQLNPDVTVRQKGIMEKCSFCVHRIIAAKIEARRQGRKVRDGEFTTACAQTCPTNAIIFGNLMDPNSRVSQLVKSPRAYQVLHHLNTKPAAIYLKRVMMEV